MDFSLLQEGTRHPGLRNVLAFDMPWMYYSVLLIDPILRFCWIPLVIFTHDLQRGMIVAFIVAFAEVTRRGMWTLFRVENEHCTNVGHLKASRDVPLPYKVISKGKITNYEERSNMNELEVAPDLPEQAQIETKPETPMLEAGQLGYTGDRLRRTGILISISRLLAKAHKQDFQKKKQDVLNRSRRSEGIELALQEDEDSDEEIEELVEDDYTDGRSSTETLTMENESLELDQETASERNL